jgi:hypothetical protein
VTLTELELPVLTRRHPILERRDVHGQRLVDLDLDRRILAFLGGGAWLNGECRDVSAVPA